MVPVWYVMFNARELQKIPYQTTQSTAATAIQLSTIEILSARRRCRNKPKKHPKNKCANWWTQIMPLVCTPSRWIIFDHPTRRVTRVKLALPRWTRLISINVLWHLLSANSNPCAWWNQPRSHLTLRLCRVSVQLVKDVLLHPIESPYSYTNCFIFSITSERCPLSTLIRRSKGNGC